MEGSPWGKKEKQTGGVRQQVMRVRDRNSETQKKRDTQMSTGEGQQKEEAELEGNGWRKR